MSARSRRRRAVGAVTLAAAAVAGIAAAPSASAYVPPGERIDAIDQLHRDLRVDRPALFEGAFRTPDGNGPDGIPVPDGTPDGQGAFQWYTGSWGQGAIYVYGNNAKPIHGAVLREWSRAGFEHGYGYPLTFPADDVQNVSMCDNRDSAQLFHQPSTGELTWVCVDWWDGTTYIR